MRHDLYHERHRALREISMRNTIIAGLLIALFAGASPAAGKRQRQESRTAPVVRALVLCAGDDEGDSRGFRSARDQRIRRTDHRAGRRRYLASAQRPQSQRGLFERGLERPEGI